jgi:hypothetical protein
MSENWLGERRRRGLASFTLNRAINSEPYPFDTGLLRIPEQCLRSSSVLVNIQLEKEWYGP